MNELNDALQQDQAGLQQSGFNRDAAATRQEIAAWFGRALRLQPVSDQQKLFNSYRDWRRADPDKIPYIEAMLQNNIMSGDDKGYFNPVQPITRKQIVQIAQNMNRYHLSSLGLIKTGTVENITLSRDFSGGSNVDVKTFDVRNSDGRMHRITVRLPGDASRSYGSEVNGKNLLQGESELVVLKGGVIGNSRLLAAGDRIEYIVSPENTVRFVNVFSSINDSRYLIARVNSIDSDNLTLDVTRLSELDYPNIDIGAGSESFDINGERIDAVYTYSNDIEVYEGDSESAIG
jgi:hypothetical protein